ncbi:MAG: DUF4340 domain-containing protein [Geminicoccaceae bacterium]
MNQPSTAPVVYVDEPVFPTLRANPDAVAKITIQTNESSVILARTSPETWVAPDHYEYPAATENINRLVRQLNDMRLIEAKTSSLKRHVRLEVEDLSDDAKSRLIRLEDDQGNVLAEALIGKRLFRLTGTEPSGTYLRRLGEEQSWLASGGFDLEPAIETWLDQLVVEIPGGQVARIEITPIEGGGYVFSRETLESDLAVEGLADGETLSDEADLSQLSSAMTSVSFAGVKPLADVEWPDARYHAKVTTFDGLDLRVELALINDEPWATFDAKNAILPTGEVVPDETNQRVESINNKTKGWVYQINQSLFQRLTKPRDSWLQQADDGTS